jgi:hypothetical protein
MVGLAVPAVLHVSSLRAKSPQGKGETAHVSDRQPLPSIGRPRLRRRPAEVRNRSMSCATSEPSAEPARPPSERSHRVVFAGILLMVSGFFDLANGVREPHHVPGVRV